MGDGAMSEWQSIETAPRDGSEVLLHYKNFCGAKNLIVTGHWDDTQGPDNATWEHSCGSGDADHWMPLPEPPK